MTDGEDWLMRPMLKGLCKYESLKDGTLDLEDISRMNASIEVERENEYRMRKANEK